MVSMFDRIATHLGCTRSIIILQDYFTFFSGIIIGIVFMALLTANFLMKLEKISDGNKKINMIRVTHKGTNKYVANLNSFKETLELVFIMAFSPMLTKRSYALKDERRTRKFLFFLSILCVTILTISIWLLSTVYIP